MKKANKKILEEFIADIEYYSEEIATPDGPKMQVKKREVVGDSPIKKVIAAILDELDS